MGKSDISKTNLSSPEGGVSPSRSGELHPVIQGPQTQTAEPLGSSPDRPRLPAWEDGVQGGDGSVLARLAPSSPAFSELGRQRSCAPRAVQTPSRDVGCALFQNVLLILPRSALQVCLCGRSFFFFKPNALLSRLCHTVYPSSIDGHGLLVPLAAVNTGCRQLFQTPHPVLPRVCQRWTAASYDDDGFHSARNRLFPSGPAMP